MSVYHKSMGKIDAAEIPVSRTLPSGILVGTTHDVEHALEHVPKVLLPKTEIPTSQVLLPKQYHEKTVFVPTPDETQEIFDQQVETHKKTKQEKRFTSTQLAQLASNPRLFLSRYLGNLELFTDNHNNDERKDVLHVLSQLTYYEDHQLYSDGGVFQESVLQRKKIKQSFFDRETREKVEYETTQPGVLEQVIIDGLHTVEMGSLYDVSPMVFGSLNALLSQYRYRCGELVFLPEMPNLVEHVIGMLEHLQKYPKARAVLYEILEQIKLSDSLAERILDTMDYHHDFDRSLAFHLLCQVSGKKESTWGRKHEKRRQELLSKLDRTPQELFDQFDELFTQSRELISGTNVQNPRGGKVGLEEEIVINKKKFKDIPVEKLDDDYRKFIAEYFEFNTQIECSSRWDNMSGFSIGYDSHGSEIRKADTSLSHDTKYVDSFNALRRWIRDYAGIAKSLHLHFDKKAHPHRPTLGGFYGEENMAIRENTLGTWEIRSLNLPKDGENISPSRFEDIIGLYLSATTASNERKEDNQIHVSEKKGLSLEKIIWGYICSYIQEPQGRLSLLMALHDVFSLQNFNPVALVHTYDSQSCVDITEYLEKVLRSEFDKIMLGSLRILSTISNENSFDEMTSYLRFNSSSAFLHDYRKEIFTVLTKDPLYIWRNKTFFDCAMKTDLAWFVTKACVLHPGYSYMLHAEQFLANKNAFLGALTGIQGHILEYQDLIREQFKSVQDVECKLLYGIALMENAKDNLDILKKILGYIEHYPEYSRSLFKVLTPQYEEIRGTLIANMDVLSEYDQIMLIHIMLHNPTIRKELAPIFFNKEVLRYTMFRFYIDEYPDESVKIFEDLVLRNIDSLLTQKILYWFSRSPEDERKYRSSYIRFFLESKEIGIKIIAARQLIKDVMLNEAILDEALSGKMDDELKKSIYEMLLNKIPQSEYLLIERYKKESADMKEVILNLAKRNRSMGDKEERLYIALLESKDGQDGKGIDRGIGKKILSKILRKH